MKKMLFCLFSTLICCSCADNSKIEKHQNRNDNVRNIKNQIKAIEINEILIGQIARLYPIGNYLIIGDYKSTDEQIHLFDATTFKYLTSTGVRGQGPHEITNLGHVEPDGLTNRKFYVSDHGKLKIFSYDLDSVLANPSYHPKVKMTMNKGQFPDKYNYINDTLSIGLIIEPIGVSGYKQSVAKYNMVTEEIKPMSYEHPQIKEKRITFAASDEHDIYVECYSYYDLMTICSLDGTLKYNIYGQNWKKEKTRGVFHYGKVIFCNDKIIATYSGEESSQNKRFPTKFLVFDLTGNYLQTLETDYQICDYCYDKKNNRLIMNLNAEMQFAFLNLDSLVN